MSARAARAVRTLGRTGLVAAGLGLLLISLGPLFSQSPAIGRIEIGGRPIRHPLDEPVFISGSFGEYRKFGRYHHGLDYKTFGRIGLPVRTPLAGRVERVHVSENGYGNALFFAAGAGARFTFAHLHDFNCGGRRDLEYFRTALMLLGMRQYRSGIISVPAPAWFRFAEGDCIARTGESGSGPPHLHFEIFYNGVYVDPLNVSGLAIADDSPPELVRLYVEGDHGGRAFDVRRTDSFTSAGRRLDRYELIGAPPVFGRDETLRVMVGAYDTMGVRNRNGLFGLEFRLDERPVYTRRIERIGAGELSASAQVYSTARTVIGREYVYLLYPADGRPRGVDLKAFARPEKTRLVAALSARDATGNESLLTFEIELADVAPGPVHDDPDARPRQKPELPFRTVQSGSTLSANAGGARIAIAFGPNSLHMPGEARLIPLEEVPVYARAQFEAGDLELAGPVFQLEARDLFYRNGASASASFPAPSAPGAGLYYFNETTGKWSILAQPRSPGAAQLAYNLPFQQQGLLAQLIDRSPPRLVSRILWDPPANLSEDGAEYVRDYLFQDEGGGYSRTGASVLLDGRPFPFEWINDSSMISIRIPRQMVPARGALLSVQAADKSGNRSRWVFEFLTPPDEKN